MYLRKGFLLSGSIILCISLYLNAQDKGIEKFHNYFDIGWYNDIGTGCSVTKDSNYLISGILMDSSGYEGYFFLLIDRQGKFIKKKYYSEPEYTYRESSSTRLQNGKTALLILLGKRVSPDSVTRIPLVVVTDDSLNQITEYRYPNTGIEYFSASRILQTKKGSIIILGGNKPDKYPGAVLIELDSNFVQRKVIKHRGSRREQFSHLIEHTNGLYYLHGISGINIWEGDYRLFVMCTDTAFNVLWKKMYSPAAIIGQSLVLSSGNIVIFSDTVLSYDFSSSEHQAALYVIDENGNLLKHAVHGHTSIYTNYLYGHVMSNGDYVIAGSAVDEYGMSYVTLSRVDSNGVLVWRHRYGFLTGSGIWGVFDMLRTSDGGFLLIGDGYGAENQDVAVIKTDSNGFDPYWNTLEFTKNIAELSANSNNNLSAYPNPTRDAVQISVPANAGHFRIAVFDAAGKMVYSEGPVATTQAHTVRLKEYKPGTYLLVLIAENKEVYHERIVLY